MKQYIVDAFTSKPFSGNPAAVCVMENWPSGEFMMKLAMENNLSETAFIVKEAAGYHLRWFTPATEVELCGHATLASSFVILNFYEPDSEMVQFNTLSGILTIRRKDNLFEMNFPTYELREIPVTDAMERAFGVRPSDGGGRERNCAREGNRLCFQKFLSEAGHRRRSCLRISALPDSRLLV